MADHGSGDQSWRTAPFRQKIVAQIDEAIRQCSSPIGRNSAEMENHVYNKAKTKDEYLSFVARLILHIREMKVPLSYFPSGASQQMGPLNQQTMAMSSLLATQNPQLGAALSNNPMGNVGVTPNSMQISSGYTGLQSRCLGTGQQRGQVPPHAGQIQLGPMAPLNKSGPKLQQAMVVQQQKQMHHNNHHPAHSPQPSVASMPPPSKPMTPLGSLPPVMGDGQMIMMMRDSNQPVGPVQFFSQSISSMPRQNAPNQFLGHSPGTMQVSNHSGMVSSPAQQIPPNMTSSQMAPSPVGYLPSHSPHIVQSPVGCSASTSSVRTPTLGAPSPGSVLNTPATIGLVASPVSRNQEDKVYLEKVKQLSKYIEPLRRMIARIDKDEDKKKEQSKMKNLLDILSNPSKRLPMDTLLKCEQVLEKLELKVKPGDPTLPSSTASAPQSVTSNVMQSHPSLNIHPHHQHLHHLPGNKEYNVCQPLLDAIVGHIGLATFSNTLQKTFAPAVAVLHGTFLSISPPQSKKLRLECSDAEIPDILQGEIARLDQRFKVNLDPIQNSGSKTVHLVCQLDDRHLPCVPPIMLIVPTGYPQKAPLCQLSSEEYESTKFLQRIHETLLERLAKMPDQFSVTSVLETWEMSVRHACSLSTGVTASSS